jgi:hypothetical protein
MRCKRGWGKVRNRNLEVAKRGNHGGSCGFNYGVEVSPSAKPTRSVNHQEAVTGVAAARQLGYDLYVALNAARRPQLFRSNTKDGTEQKEQSKTQPITSRLGRRLTCFRSMITELWRPSVAEQATSLATEHHA